MNKPKFNPNQAFEVVDKPKFDPSKPFEEEVVQPVAKQPAQPIKESVTAVAQKYGVNPEDLIGHLERRGVAPEDAGLVERGISKAYGMADNFLFNAPSFLTKKLQDSNMEKAIDDLDPIVQKNKDAGQKGLEILSSVANPIGAVGGLAMKGASTGAKLLRGAVGGGIQGAVGGLTNSKSGQEIGDASSGAGVGMAIGAAGVPASNFLEKAGAQAGDVIQKLRGGLDDFSQQQYAKVLSYLLKNKQGVAAEGFDPKSSAVMKVAKRLRDSGSFDGAGLTRKSIFDKFGEQLDAQHDTAQALASKAKDTRVGFQEVIPDLEKIMDGISQKEKTMSISKDSAAQLRGEVEEFVSRFTNSDASLSVTDLQELKRGLQERARVMGAYNAQPSEKASSELMSELASSTRGALERGVEAGAGQGTGQAFKQANQAQSDLLTGRKMLGDSIARQDNNKRLSLQTLGSLTAGAAGSQVLPEDLAWAAPVLGIANVASQQPWARLIAAKIADKTRDPETLRRTLAFLKPMVEKNGEAVLTQKIINAAARMAGATIGDKE